VVVLWIQNDIISDIIDLYNIITSIPTTFQQCSLPSEVRAPTHAAPEFRSSEVGTGVPGLLRFICIACACALRELLPSTSASGLPPCPCPPLIVQTMSK
jgi:hypothetical protein